MINKNLQTAVLGGGCFWCLEASFQLIKGVEKVVPGYAGGSRKNPTYEQVCYQNTGEAEVVKISYDPNAINYAQLLDVFWAIHDPTTPNRQGNDVGPQYRSIIFYLNDQQKELAERSMQAAQKLWKQPIVTKIVPFEKFYQAEPYHHNYFQNHPEQAYCQIIVNPKLKKLREKYASLLK